MIAYGSITDPPASDYTVFVRDLAAGTTTLASRANGVDGAPADGRADAVDMAPNGDCVVFSSGSSNLVSGFGSFDFEQIAMRVLRNECPVDIPDTSITSGPAGPTTVTTPSFGFASDDATATFECRIDGADFAGCTSPLTTAPLALGAHTFSVRATDPYGHTDASPATRAFTVDKAKPPAPRLTKLSVKPKRFRTTGRKPGTTIRFTLSRAAMVTLRFDRVLPGHRKAKRCVKGKPRRGQRKCTRFVRRGSLAVKGKKGANAKRFLGRLKGKRLAPGAYRLTAKPAGGTARSVPLTVLPRKR
jgi:hypothetical protein